MLPGAAGAFPDPPFFGFAGARFTASPFDDCLVIAASL